MADSIGPAFHVSRVGVSSQFGGDTFTIKAHFHSREQAELAKRLLETEPLIMRPRDAELVELAERHSIRSLTNGAESRWWFNFPGLRALIDAARASSIAGVKACVATHSSCPDVREGNVCSLPDGACDGQRTRGVTVDRYQVIGDQTPMPSDKTPGG